MEQLALLEDWTSYLNTKPKVVLENCLAVLRTLHARYGDGAHLHIIGIGYSGATLCSAIQTVNLYERSPMTLNCTLFRKGTDHGSSMSERRIQAPIVILDDDICTTETLQEIVRIMSYKRFKPEQVEVIVGICYKLADHKLTTERIEKLFPTTKLWIR